MASATNVLGSNNTLGPDAFLQLMVTQMQYQDPMQPLDSTQFLAQLAQFTSVQQLTTIAQTDSGVQQQLNAVQQYSELAFIHQLIGTAVNVQDTSGQTVTGNVSSVQLVNGEPQLVINGQSYPLTSLTQFS